MSEIFSTIIGLLKLSPQLLIVVLSLAVCVVILNYFRKRLTSDFDSFRETLGDHKTYLEKHAKEMQDGLKKNSKANEDSAEKISEIKRALLEKLGELKFDLQMQLEKLKAEAASLDRRNEKTALSFDMASEVFKEKIEKLSKIKDDVEKLTGTVENIDATFKGFQVRNKTNLENVAKILKSHEAILKGKK